AGSVRHFFICVERSVAEIAEDGPVIVIASRLGDHVDGGAFRPAVLGGKPLRTDLEFLHGLKGKLHHRAADGVVLVIDAVDGDVHVPAARAIYGKNGVAVLGRVIGIGGLYAWSQVGEIGDIASDHRQLLHFSRSDVLADAGLLHIDQRGVAGDLYHFGRDSRIQCRVGRDG